MQCSFLDFSYACYAHNHNPYTMEPWTSTGKEGFHISRIESRRTYRDRYDWMGKNVGRDDGIGLSWPDSQTSPRLSQNPWMFMIMIACMTHIFMDVYPCKTTSVTTCVALVPQVGNTLTYWGWSNPTITGHIPCATRIRRAVHGLLFY